jgi:hypothetical protein
MRTQAGVAIAAIAGTNVCALLMCFVGAMAEFSYVENAGRVQRRTPRTSCPRAEPAATILPRILPRRST